MTDTAPLSPSDALTYILETIRDRGWEMPRSATMYIDDPAADVRFMWGGGHEMGVRWRNDGTDAIIVWRQTTPDRQDGRSLPTATTANIDAALGFIFKGKAAE